MPCPTSHWVENYLSPLKVNPGGSTGSNLSSQRLWEASVSFTDGQLSCRETEIKPFCVGFRPAFRYLGYSLNFFMNTFWFFWCLVLLLTTCMVGAQGCRSSSGTCETHGSERLFQPYKISQHLFFYVEMGCSSPGSFPAAWVEGMVISPGNWLAAHFPA